MMMKLRMKRKTTMSMGEKKVKKTILSSRKVKKMESIMIP
jgi:hypothetical protein